MTSQDFLWGAATAAHQVEGGNENDWTRWEEKYAEQLAATAPEAYCDVPVWDEIAEKATDPDNYRSGRAVDHWNRYEEDIEHLDELGLDAYRFSIEWSRVQPSPGSFDEDAIQHYQDLIQELQEHDIEPIVTLWHFTNPQWFVDKGGWRQEDAPQQFQDYVDRMVDEFGDDVSYWVTLNEPVGYVYHTYWKDSWLDRETGLVPTYRASKNVIEAHKTAYSTIKDSHPDAQVGTANNITYFEPYDDSPVNRAFTWLFEQLERGIFLRQTLEHQDFIGVNYYLHRQVDYRFRNDDSRDESDMGWDLSPEGFGQVLHQLAAYDRPILVTEHGVADMDDTKRAEYIEESIDELRDAIKDGVDVRGYLHWSLLDNFEWDKGRWPRFGLIEVDYDTLERRVRDSARRYADLVEEGL
ncbi:MAG: family 1 glycosylhydrolase [Candidatus Nanohaloarchaea archaeon]|nr:family 1 glycosylhydrolase [Candidatus Nanohaloarchaea archaeon]